MCRLNLSILILSCLAVASGAPADVATWHVAGGRPDASDDNPGTAQMPWKTISKAAALLQPGDTVIIHGGTYREYVHPARSGTPAQPITYQGATGEEVVVSGADVVTGWVPAGDKVWKKEPWPYHFPTHPADQRLVGRCEQVIIAGRLLRQVEQRSEMPEGTFCADTANKVLYVRLPGDADPNAQPVEVSIRPVCFGVGFRSEPRDTIHVRGLTVRHAANTAQRGALAARGDHWLIEDCRVEWTNGSGLSFSGNDTTLRRVRVDHNGQQGLGGHGDGFHLEDVVLDHNNVKGFPKGWEAGGMKLARARRGVVRRCQALANDGVGLWFDVDVRDVLVEQCLCQDNAGPGIEVEISGGFRIQNNLCVHNGTDRHWCGAGILLAEADHCTVEHNTCVLNPTGISIREQGPRNAAEPSSAPVIYHVHDVTISRNICALNTRYQFGLWWDNVFFGGKLLTKDGRPRTAYDPEASHLCLDHNLYWPGIAAELTLWGCPWLPKHKQYVDLAAWQTQRKQDAHSLVADPQFVPAAADWKVKPDSPALKLGAGPTAPPATQAAVAGIEVPPARDPAAVDTNRRPAEKACRWYHRQPWLCDPFRKDRAPFNAAEIDLFKQSIAAARAGGNGH